MARVKSLDKNLYPSISDAINGILDRYLISSIKDDNAVYSTTALEEVCFFLCENDIGHQFMTIPAPAGVNFDEIVSLIWEEDDGSHNIIWYATKINKTVYRVTMLVLAETKQEIEDWLNSAEELEGLDWSVEEV